MNRLLLVMCILGLSTSCTVHRGTVSMSLLEKNMKYQDVAFGVFQFYKILGFGGLSQDAVIYEAKKEMYKNYPLSPDETYANFTLDITKTFYIVFSQIKVTMTADIVKHIDKSDNKPYSIKYMDIIGKMNESDVKLFEVGDTVIHDLEKDGIIISFVKEDEIRILFKTKKGESNTKNVSIFEIHTNKKDYNGNKIGGIYSFEEIINGEKVILTGEIIGIGINSILIKNKEGKLQVVQTN